jgi:predicted PurR-regulated permease PerM
MKLFHSTKKDTQKNIKASFDTVRELGHTPVTDWMAILLVCILVVLGIAIFTTSHYLQASTFIKELPTQNTNTDAAQIRTKEERLQDTLKMYTKKQEAHNDLLGITKSVVAKDILVATSTATSTAISTTSIASTTVPAILRVATSTPR